MEWRLYATPAPTGNCPHEPSLPSIVQMPLENETDKLLFKQLPDMEGGSYYCQQNDEKFHAKQKQVHKN